VVLGAANAEIMFTLVQPWQGVTGVIELQEVKLVVGGQEVTGVLVLLPSIASVVWWWWRTGIGSVGLGGD
jgi:hypothetical protein